METIVNIARQTAQEFVSAAHADGWRVAMRGTVATIRKDFAPGDRAAYAACDSEAYGILARIPGRGGSVWGTDGGSVGGHVGMIGGYYQLNKSGVGARVAAAVAKILAEKC